MIKRILPKSIDVLTEKLAQLPGIGPKTAARLTFSLLHRPDNALLELGSAILNLKKNLHACSQCFLITDEEGLCVICQEPGRNSKMICVVEESLDVVALEHSGSFAGLYHVLGGVISPIDGIGPDNLRIKELSKRVGDGGVEEVIIATNPSLEGEATALYITESLKEVKVKITRIGRGLPSGGDLEYADEVTLQRALEGRQEVNRN